MLPWIFIHGYRKRDDVLVRKVVSFNVAMDFHPWILGIMSTYRRSGIAASMLPWIFIHGYLSTQYFSWGTTSPLQCCHGFSSMDTPVPVPPITDVRKLQCCHGFSSMDTVLCQLPVLSLSGASMLPWIFIHGY